MDNNKTLPEIYKALPEATFPKKEFVQLIMKKTNRCQSTVEKWLRGSNRPSDIKDIKVLCDITGLNFDQLF